MRYPVINFFFIGVGLVVRLADTLGDDFGVTLLVAGVLAVRTLHAGCVLEEISAKGAAHDVIELLRDELVTLLLVDFFLLLADSTLTVEADIKRSSVL